MLPIKIPSKVKDKKSIKKNLSEFLSFSPESLLRKFPIFSSFIVNREQHGETGQETEGRVERGAMGGSDTRCEETRGERERGAAGRALETVGRARRGVSEA